MAIRSVLPLIFPEKDSLKTKDHFHFSHQRVREGWGMAPSPTVPSGAWVVGLGCMAWVGKPSSYCGLTCRSSSLHSRSDVLYLPACIFHLFEFKRESTFPCLVLGF